MAPKVLVLDDHCESRQAIRAILEEQEYEVLSVIDEEHALRKLAAQPVSAIIMDVVRTQPGGLESLRRIRRLAPGVPVIIVTESASAEIECMCIQVGVHNYLRKPICVTELLAALQRVVGDPALAHLAAGALGGA